MGHSLSSSRLRLGLTTDTTHAATVWFVATLPRASAPPVAATTHFGLIQMGQVMVPLFFLRLSWATTHSLIETSLNPFQDDLLGLTLLRHISNQDTYGLQAHVGLTETAHMLHWPSTHQPLYRQTVKLLEAQPPWTHTQFLQAQKALALSWPTAEDRFRHLGDVSNLS